MTHPRTLRSIHPRALALTVVIGLASGAPAKAQSHPFLDEGLDSSFHVRPNGYTNFYGSASGDVDGDGDVDIVYSRVTAHANDVVLIIARNDGAGRFTPCAPAQCPAAAVGSHYPLLHLVDMDGDRDLDLIHADAIQGGVVFWENDGAGGFSTPKGLSFPSLGKYICQALIPADLDGDGDQDLLLGGLSQDSDRIVRNNGSWKFVLGPVLPGPKNHVSTGVCAADANNDGVPDILTTYRVGSPILWLGSAAGRYRAVTFGVTGLGGRFADLDGDGWPEVLLYDGKNSSTQIYRADRRGGYSVAGSFNGFFRLACDWDRDGDLDIFGNYLLRNDGNLRFVDVTTSLIETKKIWVTEVFQPALVDVDGDQDPDFLAMDIGAGGVWPNNYQWQSPVVLRNRLRELNAPEDIQIGNTVQVEARVDHAHTLHLAVSARESRYMLGSLGVLRVDPAAMVLLPSQVSNQRAWLTWRIPVPNLPVLVGQTAFWQGLDQSNIPTRESSFTVLRRTKILR